LFLLLSVFSEHNCVSSALAAIPLLTPSMSALLTHSRWLAFLLHRTQCSASHRPSRRRTKSSLFRPRTFVRFTPSLSSGSDPWKCSGGGCIAVDADQDILANRTERTRPLHAGQGVLLSVFSIVRDWGIAGVLRNGHSNNLIISRACTS
jgi:hypothetical protein